MVNPMTIRTKPFFGFKSLREFFVSCKRVNDYKTFFYCDEIMFTMFKMVRATLAPLHKNDENTKPSFSTILKGI